jgi:hypothetical protein
LIFLESICESENCLLSLLIRHFLPRLESLLAGGNSSIYILLGRDWDGLEGLAGGRVGTMASLARGGELAIDGVLVVGEDIESWAGGTHDCGCIVVVRQDSKKCEVGLCEEFSLEYKIFSGRRGPDITDL